jgi:diguanylate cyclase (GGDEF)-like protein
VNFSESVNPEEFSILICDDEESIRSMLSEAVSGWGFQVATAPNGESAHAYLKAGNLPHIILTDIRMGGMTGIELAAEAKKISKEIEVVIMTSHGTFETAVQAMRIGVFDYISKPFDNIEDVRTTLIHVAERIYLKFYSEFLLSEVQRKNIEIQNLSDMTFELAKTLDIQQCLDVGCSGISKAFSNIPVVYWQWVLNQNSLMLAARSHVGLLGDTQVKFMLPKGVGDQTETVIQFMQDLGQTENFQSLMNQSWDLSSEELKKSLRFSQGTRWATRPLVTRGVPRGVFALPLGDELNSDGTALFDRYIQTIATSFENAFLHAKVVQSSIKDSLTGLYNVRHFKDRFKFEIQAATRLQHPVSLLFFDVDHFKKYNDTHGHPAGDLVLKKVADLLRKNFRATDITARYGGEEFVVLLPHTAFVDALEKAEHFRKVLEDEPFPNEHTQPLGKVTASIGVSEYPSHGASMEAVIKAADDALYEGKKKSRNTVVAGVPESGYVPAFRSTSLRTQPNTAKKG